jgi:ADP-ribosylation factor related protein 1
MFTLMSGCLQWLTEKEQLNVLIVGLPNSGKTSVLEQQKRRLVRGYRGPSLDNIQTTMGMNLGKLPINGMIVTCWDVGGSMPSVWDRYYADADGIVFVVDSSDVSAFDHAARALGVS